MVPRYISLAEFILLSIWQSEMSQIQQLYDANGNPVDMSMFYTQPPNQGQLPTYTETKSQTVQQVQTQQVSGQPIQQAQQKSYQLAQQTY